MSTIRKQGTKRKTKDHSPTASKPSKSNDGGNFQKPEAMVEDEKPNCKYGEKCYQKNSYHLSRFRHSHREALVKSDAENLEEQNSSSGKSQTILTGKNLNEEISHEEQSPPQPSTLLGQELEDLSPLPEDPKEIIKQKFLVQMPDDFYSFWEFWKTLKEENALDCLGLKFVGPFEILEGNKQVAKQLQSYLLDWRFYFDPPEFQVHQKIKVYNCYLLTKFVKTIVIVDMHTGHHLGYFRDSPKELPQFVGSNVESLGCTIVPYGDNIFSALRFLIYEELKKADPFLKTKLTKLKSQIESWASEKSFPLENYNIKRRKKHVVAKTFYQSGIVVPVNKKSNVGYRPIPKSDNELKKLCKKITESNSEAERNKNFDELQTLITYVQYANDEMDYGMGLELGLDLLAYGSEFFHSSIEHLLTVAYELLERQEFSVILKAHLSKRKKLVQQEMD